MQQIRAFYTEAGGIDAGVASKIFFPDHVLIHQEPYLIVVVVHQSHHTDGARGNSEIFYHEFLRRKGKTRAVDLMGNVFRLKLFICQNHQQIEFSFLRVAQKQVFADGGGLQYPVDRFTGFHGKDSFVIHPVIGDLQGIQQILYRQFCFRPAVGVGGASAV